MDLSKDFAVFVLIIVVFVAIFLWQKKKAKKEEAKEEAEKAARLKQAQADWDNSYANPNSPNYDPERVAREEAENQEANS